MSSRDLSSRKISPHLLDLRDPVPDGVEGLLVRHVVNKEDALCTSEIGGGDGAEALLPGGVPNLKLDSLGIAEKRAEEEEAYRERGRERYRVEPKRRRGYKGNFAVWGPCGQEIRNVCVPEGLTFPYGRYHSGPEQRAHPAWGKLVGLSPRTNSRSTPCFRWNQEADDEERLDKHRRR